MKLFEWHSAAFDEHKRKIPEFIEYLSNVWQNRNRFLEQTNELSEEEQQEQKIQKQRFFDFTVDGKISARNYVGVVQFENIRIEIYPKMFANDKTGDARKWQLNLLYWLTYCRKISFPFTFADLSKLNFDDYLELLIYIFANYAQDILSNQPFQAYQGIEEETTFLKGSLAFDNYTKHILTTGNWQNFFCSYAPFVYDNLFNRIIKYVSRRLSSISENSINKEKLNEILFILDDVSDLRCTAEDCDKVKLNQLYNDHSHILELCKLYLSNKVIDMDFEDSRNFCFLVPMEYIFEDFVFGFISEKWPMLNLVSQSSDFLALNQDLRVFQIKNDIYINDTLIIDTKYKVRPVGDGLKCGVNQNDLYQVVSYSLRRNCKDSLLLYPYIESAMNSPALFRIPSQMLSEHLNIQVHSLDITFDNLSEADETIRGKVEKLSPIFL